MFTYDTEKGELCQIECWADEDREERYLDGDHDLIWIDRHHTDKYGDIENYISQKFADIGDTVFIDVRALRSSDVTVFEEGDEYYGLFPDNIAIDELGDDCLGGNDYIWEQGKLKVRCDS